MIVCANFSFLSSNSSTTLFKYSLRFVTGSGSEVGQALIDHPQIQAISFTGSNAIGKRVATSAAERGIKFQLEMGGKNPVIIAKDANLDAAVKAVMNGAFLSTGQKCTATSRVIVEEAVFDEFVEKLKEATEKLKVGNAIDEDAFMGPSAHESQFNTVIKYLQIAEEEGATLFTGGKQLTGGEYDDGYFIAPTIYKDVTPDMTIAKEEIFGPVIALFKVKDLDEAIELANDTEYGLSASMFTTNIQSFLEFADEIEAGMVRVNAESTGAELQAPFGGIKGSSYGPREQGEATKEFYTEIKTIFVKG